VTRSHMMKFNGFNLTAQEYAFMSLQESYKNNVEQTSIVGWLNISSCGIPVVMISYLPMTLSLPLPQFYVILYYIEYEHMRDETLYISLSMIFIWIWVVVSLPCVGCVVYNFHAKEFYS